MQIPFVCDNGIGIALQFHKRILGLFHRHLEGTDIGPTLAKRIVDAHGPKG
jgi:signal transduction histidine kinase